MTASESPFHPWLEGVAPEKEQPLRENVGEAEGRSYQQS